MVLRQNELTDKRGKPLILRLLMVRGRKFILKLSGMRCLALLAILFFTFVLTHTARAQIGRRQTEGSFTGERVKPSTDSLSLTDTVGKGKDTASRKKLEEKLGIRISPDALSAPVSATATDSAVLDMEHNQFYLYGEAKMSYEEVKLSAGQVMYDQGNNLITAAPLYDSTGVLKDKPTFEQGTEKFTYDSLKYNFKTKRALVRNARSQYGEGFVVSKQIKRNPDESIYGLWNGYTTCSLDTPHFSIRAKHIKIIPNRIIVAGAANLEIEHVPTPIWLPFAVFPITQSQRSGFQLPSYTLEERRGLGLTNIGYYFYINDYVDLLANTSIYSKGSYNVSLLSTYANRYRYSGGVSFNYGYEKTGEDYEPTASIKRSYAFMWRHTTDPKAKPGQSFNANVNIQKGNYYARNSYAANEIIQNIFTSSVTYTKNWQGKPYGLTIALLHDQNTLTKIVNVTLPQFTFFVSQFNPFQRKHAVGSQKWYEKITLSYTLSGLAKTSFYDTAFSLRTLSLNDFNAGIQHSIPISASYTALRFINVSFGVNYNEYWLTRRLYQYYNNNENALDTVQSRGFYTARDANATMQLSTRIYGVKLFKHGKIAGIRHVLTPNIGFNYTPDYAAAPFHYYYRTYTSAAGYLEYRSPYEGSVVGTPGQNQYGNFNSSINFGLNNNLQIKTRTKKDTVTGTRNVTLIDGLGIAANYNLAADSFKWSSVNLSFRTNVLNIINISAGANFDPYKYDYDQGRRVNISQFGNGGFVRFNDASVSLSTTLRSKQTTGNNSQTPRTDEVSRMMGNGYRDYVDFNIPWSLNVSYALTVNKESRSRINGGDTLRLAQNSTLFSGDFNLTPKWKVTFTSGYNFAQKQLSITSIDIYRDLHCWEMRLGTIPFGPNKNYNFTLNVKASVLQDLRLLRRRDYRDAVY